MELKAIRKRIDRLDESIVSCLNKRAELALAVARAKRMQGKSMYSPDREQQVLKNVRGLARGPLEADALAAIYREVISSSLALEKKLRVAYLGPQATFTHQAALKRFGSQADFSSCASIADVFADVEKGSVDYGVVPVENSIEGAVNHTLDMFIDSDVKICSQVTLAIAHNLLSRYPKDKIAKVYSNPQVFGQCRSWLQTNLGRAELVEVSSTTRASQIASREKYSAAIASKLAAKLYGLKVIAADIEDSAHNKTRFFVIGTADVARTGHDRTSLLFSIKDKVGALHDMLMPFRKYRVNLSKIESRPSKRRAWDYYFFIDIAGHQQDKNVKRALQELENKSKFLKILGSYPIGE